MHRKSTSIPLVLLVVSLTFLSLAVTTATEAAEGIVAEVENTGSTLIFHPVVEFKELVLTVTGPCNYVYRQVVNDGEPMFKLGETTIDGLYSYELVVMPRIAEEILAILQNARKTGDNEPVNALCRDGKLPGAPATQAAGFVVYKGRIEWDPNLQEDKSGKAVSSSRNRSTQAPMSVSAASYVGYTSAAEKAAKDFVIIDDLIVDGSACIGFDCVNGESFGFDTIRLKENNLRIKFDDTSTAASFPRNDWQLTANDSANGGLSKFSIDDISGSRTPFTIEANARSHSLYVDDGGRIGSRTSTPSVELHTVDGDTPTLRLQQDGSSGFAPQTWDVAGNETNFFIRDVTNGSQLSFRIQPDTPSSTLTMRSTGYVGVGTWSPENKLDIYNGTDDNFGFQLSRSAVQWVVQLNKSTDTGGAPDGLAFTRVGSGVREMQLQADGDLYIEGDYYSDGTQLNVPDFVFDDGYNLLPLNELERFIKEQKHLPNVPSADRIKEEGLNVSELQMRLLEKVEELTLYTVAQEAKISQQDAIIAELTARLEALELTK